MPATESIMLQTLAIPCRCRCRYCLLSSEGKTNGAELKACDEFAKRFSGWLKENRPEIKFDYSFGYCMERPDMAEALDLLNEIGSVTGKFLQLDGMKMRNEAELESLMRMYREHGVESINLTFYGNEEYHDCFAGRKCDRALLLRTLAAAKAEGLVATCGYALTEESKRYAEETLNELLDLSADRVRFFIPHSEGRGERIEGIRLDRSSFEALPKTVRERMNRAVYRTEGEWLHADDRPKGDRRALLISLTDDNILQYEQMGFAALIDYVERLDDEYYALFPDFNELAKLNGNDNGTKLFSFRDLYMRYRRMFADERGLTYYDVTDERQTGSRRY